MIYLVLFYILSLALGILVTFFALKLLFRLIKVNASKSDIFKFCLIFLLFQLPLALFAFIPTLGPIIIVILNLFILKMLINKRFNVKIGIPKVVVGYLVFSLIMAVSLVGYVTAYKNFVGTPFVISGSSMEPTIPSGKYIMAQNIASIFSPLKRKDIVVFNLPDKQCKSFVKSGKGKVSENPCRFYVKRIIGLPNETIEIKDGIITIFNNENPAGFVLDEKEYAKEKLFGNQKVKLKNNEYFVIGDNRTPNGSSDSREWGPLEKEFIVGRSITLF